MSVPPVVMPDRVALPCSVIAFVIELELVDPSVPAVIATAPVPRAVLLLASMVPADSVVVPV